VIFKELFDSLVRVAGVLHFSQPLSMFIAPRLLHLNEDVKRMSPLGQKIFKTLLKSYTMTIVATGILAIVSPRVFYAGGVFGAILSSFLCLFFFYRLYAQKVYSPDWPKTPYGRFSHVGLSLLFLFLGAVYSLCAMVSMTQGRIL
jgi:hypothetical protein